MIIDNLNIIFGLNIFLPITLLILISVIPNNRIDLIKKISLVGTIILFLLSVYLLIIYNISINLKDHSWFDFKYYSNITYLFNLQYVIGLDGISILLINLTTLLIPLCILVNITTIRYRFKDYVIMLLLLEILLLNTFSVLNLLFFYIFFESVLIPMFVIIGI